MAASQFRAKRSVNGACNHLQSRVDLTKLKSWGAERLRTNWQFLGQVRWAVIWVLPLSPPMVRVTVTGLVMPVRFAPLPSA